MTIRTMIEIIFFIVDPFKSYQILRSVVAIMLIVKNLFEGLKFFCDYHDYFSILIIT